METFNNFETLDYGARFYDPALGRWTTRDPLCEDGGQESSTFYGYVFNDPIKHNDPDVRFPLLSNLVGAAAGALVEYAGQVAANIHTQGLSTSAFTENIDVADIAIAAGDGFLTSGGSIVKNALADAKANAKENGDRVDRQQQIATESKAKQRQKTAASVNNSTAKTLQNTLASGASETIKQQTDEKK
ncbi:hypothetical protein SDC9_95967 [bioreactor metagenome]|uniref:RHS repeat-associated core domain-containing protein n=1 Tax=bioreactor metagenome TaxID=1076179 RepID=A0A645A7T1_9ZZZZ